MVPNFQFSSVAQSCLTLLPHGLQHARLSYLIPNSQSPLKLMSIESVMPSNRLTLCCPLFLLPSFFPSIRVFSNESSLCIRYWSFSFNVIFNLLIFSFMNLFQFCVYLCLAQGKNPCSYVFF